MTFTKEQLIKKAQEQIAFCRHTKITGEGLAHVNQCAALFEIALATMGSEPVRNPVLAYADSYRDMAKQGVESVPIWSVITDLERNIAPLYRHAQPAPECQHQWKFGGANKLQSQKQCIKCGRVELDAQPAPVVPEDVSGPLAHAYKELTPTFMRNHIAVFERYGIAPNDSSTVIQALRIALDGIERRAAMLQADNSQVIPGWIPVSERMPIDFEAVIAFDGDQVYGEAMYSSDDGFTIDGYEPCDRLKLQNVTHWMPLPPPPKEVK